MARSHDKPIARPRQRSAETSRTSDRVATITLALAVWAPLFAWTYFFLGAPICSMILAAAGFAVIGVIQLLGRGVRPASCAHLTTLIAFATYTALAIRTGGHFSPPAIWYVTIPVLAASMLGGRRAVPWTLASTLSVAFFYAIRERGLLPPSDIGLEEMHFLEALGLLGLLLCIFATVYAHDRIERDLEETLRRSLQRAQDADRAKTEFLTNVSHELRTPMTAIIGFAERLLEDGDLAGASKDSPDAVLTIHRNGRHLLSIIDDLLDLAKIEAGMVDVEQAPFSPRRLVEDVVATLKASAAAKGLRLEAKFDAELPAAIVSDPCRLRQILVNLTGNAIKFTRTGGVSIAVGIRRSTEEGPKLTIRVIDSGVGIPGERMPTLFYRFSTGAASQSQRHRGAGLGLAISNRLATLLGGSLAVRSRPNVGSTFTLTLPAIPAVSPEDEGPGCGLQETQAAGLEFKHALQGCRILYAENDADNQRLIVDVLKTIGAAEVAVADNGLRVVERLTADGNADGRLADPSPFDVVVLGMQMPELGGYEAVAILRAKGFAGPIVALTSHAMAGDREKCLLAGCDDYLAKPVDRQRLAKTILRHWSPAKVELAHS